jgi:hypothetical protein
MQRSEERGRAFFGLVRRDSLAPLAPGFGIALRCTREQRNLVFVVAFPQFCEMGFKA